MQPSDQMPRCRLSAGCECKRYMSDESNDDDRTCAILRWAETGEAWLQIPTGRPKTRLEQRVSWESARGIRPVVRGEGSACQSSVTFPLSSSKVMLFEAEWEPGSDPYGSQSFAAVPKSACKIQKR